jgi:hypothetical protein
MSAETARLWPLFGRSEAIQVSASANRPMVTEAITCSPRSRSMRKETRVKMKAATPASTETSRLAAFSQDSFISSPPRRLSARGLRKGISGIGAG